MLSSLLDVGKQSAVGATSIRRMGKWAWLLSRAPWRWRLQQFCMESGNNYDSSIHMLAYVSQIIIANSVTFLNLAEALRYY